jgi:hypothetical protein
MDLGTSLFLLLVAAVAVGAALGNVWSGTAARRRRPPRH